LAIAARYGARDVRVFGSAARGDADAAGDLDLFVRLEPGRSLLDLGGFQVDVEELLGCRVDVATDYGQASPFAERVRREARAL
jgi:predicted nucleotidyltransferase